MHHDDIDGPAWDLPPRAAPPARRIVICSTPRSGSYLLCRQMINAGLGVPHEYFRARTVAALAARYGVAPRDDAAYVDALEAHRTTANGVFAAKLQWQHLERHPLVRERLLARADALVFLYRRDVVAQAVSWHVSLATGYWSFDATPGPRAPDVALDAPGQTPGLVRTLVAENRAWESLLATLARPVLAVAYESLVREQSAFLRQLAAACGLPPGAWTPPPPEARDARLPPDVERARETLLRHARAAYAPAAPAP
jgi:LPS sulfotransferase NodH